jgi:hypothetical protein
LTLLFLPAAYAAWLGIREPAGKNGVDGKAVVEEGARHGVPLSA